MDTPLQIETCRGLIEAELLYSERDNDKLKILDATWYMPQEAMTGLQAFRLSHIPSAQFFDIDGIADRDTALPHMLPSANMFAQAVGKMGIANDDWVVVYDAHGLRTAARLWWTFRVFGHDQVVVLNGGLPRWQSLGYPVSKDSPNPQPRHFTPRLRPQLVRHKSDILANIKDQSEILIDARSPGRFRGDEPEVWPRRRSGHIPGSRNLPFTSLLQPPHNRLLEPSQLRRVFEDAAIPLTEPIVTSCGSGVTAAILALALYRIGKEDVAIYDGSWAEWGLPGDTPVATGPQHSPAPIK